MKQYQQHFNVITLHLPGHGNSPSVSNYTGFSFSIVAGEVIKTLDYLKIKHAHFVGISLGSVIIHYILKERPKIVKSATLAGAMTRFNLFSNVLYTLGKLIKSITPHVWIYNLFAYMIMPKSNHKKSRSIFIKEAKKMRREDFIGWFDAINDLKESYLQVQTRAKGIPKLYVSGNQDHLFIDSLKKDIKQDEDAHMRIIENCGHVCNLDGFQQFNKISLEFLKLQEKAVRKIS